MTNKQLGRQIRAARIDAGYPTCYQFAKAAGTKASQIADWESGKHSPTIGRLVEVFDVAGVDVRLTFTPPTQQPPPERSD
jgi:transcriptional regulator with XRE-family HTH domain